MLKVSMKKLVKEQWWHWINSSGFRMISSGCIIPPRGKTILPRRNKANIVVYNHSKRKELPLLNTPRIEIKYSLKQLPVRSLLFKQIDLLQRKKENRGENAIHTQQKKNSQGFSLSNHACIESLSAMCKSYSLNRSWSDFQRRRINTMHHPLLGEEGKLSSDIWSKQETAFKG